MQNNSLASDKYALAAMKSIAIEEFLAQYQQLKTSWGGYAGYDAWVKQANNAAFGALAVYDDGVPQFEALFAQQGEDWTKFYAAVQDLAALPKAARLAALKAALKATVNATPNTSENQKQKSG